MGIISWIVVGLIAGWLAEQFIRGPKFGLLGATILGIIGGIIGGYLASTLLNLHNPVTGIRSPPALDNFLQAALGIIFKRIRRLNAFH